MHGLPNCPQPSNAPPNTHLLIFFQLRTPFKQVLLFCADQNITPHWRRRWTARWQRQWKARDNTTATTVMEGATATAIAMDGAMAMQLQWKAQWQHEGNNGNGRRNGNGNGQQGGNAMAMAAMDGVMAMAMNGTMETRRQQKAQQQCDGNDGDSNGRQDDELSTTAADARILPTPNPQEG
jgi:hypothetical protein